MYTEPIRVPTHLCFIHSNIPSIVVQDGSNDTITINQDFRMFAGILEGGKTVTHSLAGLDGQQGTSRFVCVYRKYLIMRVRVRV